MSKHETPGRNARYQALRRRPHLDKKERHELAGLCWLYGHPERREFKGGWHCPDCGGSLWGGRC